MCQVYVHYGSANFEPDYFSPISNDPVITKPDGGLWGSPINSPRGWAYFCETVGWNACDERNSFKFKLKNSSNVLKIDSLEVLEGLPKRENPAFIPFVPKNWVCLDFEKLLEDGVDAVHVEISKDYRLNQALYTWDCDSVLVMNKDAVIQI